VRVPDSRITVSTFTYHEELSPSPQRAEFAEGFADARPGAAIKAAENGSLAKPGWVRCE